MHKIVNIEQYADTIGFNKSNLTMEQLLFLQLTSSQSQYGNGTKAVFEGISVTDPENYDEYLTQKYENWRQDPPVEKQKSHHEIAVYDAKRSYVEYLNQPFSTTVE